MKSNKLCECGCGEYTNIATRNRYNRGQIKGQAMRIIARHAWREKTWNKGIKMSKEFRERVSIGHKGQVVWNTGKKGLQKAWNKGISNPNIQGEKCRFWKGGITPINHKIRNSIMYKQWREAVFKRDNYTCVWCGDNTSGNLNADHIKPFAYFPKLRFKLSNGRTLCVDCHKTTDSYMRKMSYV